MNKEIEKAAQNERHGLKDIWISGLITFDVPGIWPTAWLDGCARVPKVLPVNSAP